MGKQHNWKRQNELNCMFTAKQHVNTDLENPTEYLLRTPSNRQDHENRGDHGDVKSECSRVTWTGHWN
jgi:hypothetical protein